MRGRQMLSGNGRHRRPKQAPALLVAFGVTGAGLALPLLGAGSAQAISDGAWDRTAECESGGVWSANSGNGYYGGFQLTLGMWEDYGGLEFADRPDLASRAQQITVAERILADQGLDGFPGCALLSGLWGEYRDENPELGVPPTDTDASGGSEDDAGASGDGNGSDGSENGSEADDGASGSADGSDGEDDGSDSGNGSSDSQDGSDSGSDASGGSDAAEDGSGASDDGSAADDGASGAESGAGADDGASDESEGGSDADDGASGDGSAAENGSPGSENGSGASDSGSDASGGSAAEGEGSDSSEADADASGGSAAQDGTAEDSGAEGAGSAGGTGHTPTGRHRGDPDPAESGLRPNDVDRYDVRSGDSLCSIADDLGVPGGWSALYQANKSLIGDDPDRIFPGQELDLTVTGN
ncbi:transglycosylase family protein [Streptomyces sp. B6B3]|uniref:transglycosylase family protein n=1 Tax=Streptomyces sp. B6B3 TaxID=3153570 RepID=UPI00325CDEC2